jgi:hypothetical protein
MLQLGGEGKQALPYVAAGASAQNGSLEVR